MALDFVCKMIIAREKKKTIILCLQKYFDIEDQLSTEEVLNLSTTEQKKRCSDPTSDNATETPNAKRLFDPT